MPGLTACGGSDGPDPEVTGARSRAVQVLRDYGLSKADAGCMVDRLGAEVVNEAPDITALTQGQAYQDASKACLDGD